MALGDNYGVPISVEKAVKKDLEEAIAAGFFDKGIDAVILNLEETTGVQVRSIKLG